MNELSPQDINANQLAEKQADAAAMQGNWEAYAQPGFEQSAGTIAVEAMQKYAVGSKVEPVSEEATHIDITDANEPAVDIAVISDPHNRVPFTKRDGFSVRDTRRNTPESVEADFRDREADKKAMEEERQEAFHQPLSDADIVDACKSLAATLFTEVGQDPKPERDFEGDMRGIFRLSQLESGETLGSFGDYATDKESKTIDERLDSLIKGQESGRVVDGETGQVMHVGYGAYYQFKRAKFVLNALTADPKATREQIIAKGQNVSRDLIDTVLAPMNEDLADIPDRQKIYPDSRVMTMHQTMPTAYGRWAQDSSRKAA